ETELLGRRRVPNGRQLDTLADTLASMEYYLEALREHRGNRQHILDIARQSLEALGYWPLPPEPEKAMEPPEPEPVRAQVPAADVEEESAAGTIAALAGRVDTAPPSGETGVPQAALPAADGDAGAEPGSMPAPVGGGGFEATGDEIDDEIREVFLEEFAEEIDNLDTLLPPWREKPEDLERLRPIRRVFHTLKGSGRLVGARTLGEFSWKVESLLNRVLDGSRAPTPAVLAVVDHAFHALPMLLAALKGERSIELDLPALEADAERIAAGEEVMPQSPLRAVPAGEPAAAPEPVAEPRAVPAPELAPAAAHGDAAPAEAGEPETAVAPAVEAQSAPRRIPARVDELLLEILDAEIAGHLVAVDHWLAAADAAPTPASEALLRAVHTMNGAFAMAEVPAVTGVLAPAESWVRRLLVFGGNADANAVDAMGELAALVRDAISGLKSEDPGVPEC